MEITMSAMRRMTVRGTGLALMLMAVMAIACGGKKPPVARPTPPEVGPDTVVNGQQRPPVPPAPVNEPTIVPPEPIRDEVITSGSLDDLNRNSPLRPVFFELDSAELSPDAQKILDTDANLMRQNGSWQVTIEGHCDERGTPEYNLALGERRALAARAYLVSLGLPADRLKTVSYGKEFPFDPGHDEPAYAKNRRAHFVITAK
jgi:peptidoglycan-associated lipoprotein